MNLKEKRERGQKARAIVESELFNDAFDLQVKTLHEQWATEPDSQTRDRLWFMLQGTKNAKEVLKRILGDGKDAEREIKKAAQK